jgi:flagellar basal body-associated protein FliL
MKSIIFIVVFLGATVAAFAWYVHNLETSFYEIDSGIAFNYPPFLNVNSNVQSGSGALKTIILSPFKNFANNKALDVVAEHPLILIELRNKNPDKELEQWLTSTRDSLWAKAPSNATVRLELNGNKAISFDMPGKPYSVRSTIIDFGEKVIYISTEYSSPTDRMLGAWKTVSESLKINSTKSIGE